MLLILKRVPQESILGTLLYLLYVFRVENITYKLSIPSSIPHFFFHEMLRYYITIEQHNDIDNSMVTNRLKFNQDSTKFFISSRYRP